MEIITGRLTADAEVKQLQNDKKVTNFRLAINYRYRRNGETVEDTTFVDCSYWLGANLAKYLTKGTQVQLYGRLGINAWVNNSNEAKAVITFHVNDLTLLGKPGNNDNAGKDKANESAVAKHVDTDITGGGDDDDDLPF